MSKARLYQYAILWHPTEKQAEDDGKKSLLITPPATVLAESEGAAAMAAARAIPDSYADQLDQVEIALRPF